MWIHFGRDFILEYRPVVAWRGGKATLVVGMTMAMAMITRRDGAPRKGISEDCKARRGVLEYEVEMISMFFGIPSFSFVDPSIRKAFRVSRAKGLTC